MPDKRNTLEPTFEPQRAYVVKGDLLNQIARALKLLTPHAGAGIELKQVSQGVIISAAAVTTYHGLRVHSYQDPGVGMHMGLGPLGRLYDARVGGALEEVEIGGRLEDPTDLGDAGWFSLVAGDVLVLECTLADGDIASAAVTSMAGPPVLVEWDGYTPTLFRVPLGEVRQVGGKDKAVTLHDGDLIAEFTVIHSKLAKYAR